MTAINDFITNARAHNIDDETIRQTLASQGWEPQVVTFALLGMEVPTPDAVQSNTPAAITVDSPEHPSLHPLLAALHHVLLWFFVIASTIAIVGVVASLFGESVDASALAAMIAVVAITFTPYAILFVLYLRKLRRQPNLVPGKVWSIITICLNSLSALGAAITLVVTSIVGGETSVIVGAALVFALTALVAVVYIMAAFAPSTWKARLPFLVAYLPAVALLLGTLFVLSLVRIGPALQNEKLRTSLVTTIENIQPKIQSLNRLPTPQEVQPLVANADISYTALSDITYELCVTFVGTGKSSKQSYLEGTKTNPITDSYVSTSQFYRPQGRQCFIIESRDLQEKSTSTLNSYMLPLGSATNTD